MSGRYGLEYVLPLRWEGEGDVDELAAYVRWLADRVDVTVVDGSPGGAVTAHRRAWPEARVMVPDVPGRNGKARGAVTGIRAARHPMIIVADDDVRYDDASLSAMVARLADTDFVRPQNHWRPMRWHARWDTGRSLVNRALGGDFSGTVGVRADLAQAGYDTDVLFENLELERTVRARGGRVDVARDLYVVRLPADGGRFVEQRVRQAYDDFAQPVRLLVELALLPAIMACLRRSPRALTAGAAAVVALAEVGRRRAGGRDVYERTAAIWALPWVCERAVTVWVALGWRLRGGVPYRGERLRRAGTPLGALKKKERR